MNIDKKDAVRFLGKVHIPTSPKWCWTWQGAKSPGGYGRFTVNGKDVMAHRFSYELFIGPIPPGRDVDHVCGTRDCPNPVHLEAVTRSENCLRGGTGEF